MSRIALERCWLARRTFEAILPGSTGVDHWGIVLVGPGHVHSVGLFVRHFEGEKSKWCTGRDGCFED